MPQSASSLVARPAHCTDALHQLATTIESRKPGRGADPQSSYVARLLHKGPDAFLKKIGEEAAEVLLAAKDVDAAMLGQILPGADPEGPQVARARLVAEVADLWFHSMVALAHYGLSPADVVAELQRREGTSGLVEKASRVAAD